MKDKSYFFRKDLDTYKPKFKMLCREKRIETEISLNKVVPLENKDYICRIKIQEL